MARTLVIKKTVHRQAGFTLLELLIVLSIIALVTTLIIPAIRSTDGKTFDAQVRQNIALLSYARRMAIVASTPQTASMVWESEDILISFQADENQLPEEADNIEIKFFPEGGSTGGIINFELDGLTASVKIDPVTGRISSE